MTRKILYTFFCLFTGLSMTISQEAKVSGLVVSEEDNKPVIGASVLVKGTTIGTITGTDGTFVIFDIPENATTLVVSFIGMQTKEVAIEPSVKVVLKQTAEELEEVMVVAYGTVRRSAFTGSATVLEQDKLITPTASIDKSMAGRLSGVQIFSKGGQPGSSTSFRIRGTGSLNASNEPLIVIDGIAISNMEYSRIASKNSSSSNILASLNPNDVQSVTVLKDAAAAALYGSRAANGVILVTTKSGRKGKTKVFLDTRFSWAALGKKYETMNSAEYYQTLFNYYLEQSKGADWANEQTQKAITHNPYNVKYPIGADGNLVENAHIVVNTDWQKEVFNTAMTRDYTISMSGGNDIMTQFFSIGYLNQNGIAPASNYKRYSAKAQIDSKIGRWMKIGLNTNFSHSIQNTTVSGTVGASPIYNALTFPNAVPLYIVDNNGIPILDSNGNKQYNFNNPVSLDFNPIAIPEMDVHRTKIYRLLASAYLELEPIKNLKLKTVFSPDFITNDEHRYFNKEHGDGPAYKGRIDKYHTTDLMYTSTNTISYDRTFHKTHYINVLAGMEYWQSSYEYLQAGGRGLLGNIQELDVASGSFAPSSLSSKEVLISYFSQARYAWSDKYNISLSLRTDGSSLFGSNTKWGTFWSTGFSWKVKQEKFLKDISWIDNLKIRLSYGTSGNKGGLSRYQSMGLWTISSENKYNTGSGIRLTQLANKELGWEKQKMFNIGIDFSFWNRFYGTVDYFKKISDGLLYDLPISSETGLTKIKTNAAQTANYGFEVVMGTQILRNTSVKWNIELNASFIKDEIKKLHGGNNIRQTRYQKIWSIGGSQYEFYMPTWAGTDNTNGMPLWYKVNSDGTRTTTSSYKEATYERQGTSTPDVYGGLSNSLSYKNFNLNIQLNYQFGGKVYDGLYRILMNGGSSFGKNMHTDNLKAWTTNNKLTDIPKIGANEASNSLSSRFLYDASYIKIKNITLSYTLPKLSGIVNNLRFFISADNLAAYYFSDYQGYDDLDIYGTQGYAKPLLIPIPRTWTLGINAAF